MAHQFGVVGWVKVDFGSGEGDLLESLFGLLGPFLHEFIHVGHVLAVVHHRQGLVIVHLANIFDPPGDFLGVLVGVFYALHYHVVILVSCAHVLLHVGHSDDCLILGVQAGLVQNIDAKRFSLAIGSRHFELGVNFSNRGNVVGDEGLQLGLQVDLLRLEIRDVDEQVLHFLRHIQISVLCGIISPGNWPIIILSLRFLTESSWLGSCCQVFLRLGLLLLGRNDIFFLTRIDVVVFIVIDFKRHVKMLILDLVLFSFGW